MTPLSRLFNRFIDHISKTIGAMKRLVFWSACAVILILSLSPAEHLPEQLFSIWDIAQHALAFAGLMVLGLWAYPSRGKPLAIGLLAYGLGIEFAQAATGWRYGEAADLMADAVGIALVWVWRQRLKRQDTTSTET